MVCPRVILCFFVSAALACAQRATGELSISVTDESGAALHANGALVSRRTGIRQSFTSNDDGKTSVRDLPAGTYHVKVERQGFAPSDELVDLRSGVPTRLNIVLHIAPVESEVVVRDSATLIDPHETTSVYHVGEDQIRERNLTEPGRGLLNLVNDQPGWLLEANGVLHPRGSEYDTQYVVDGIPVTDNRSPAFVPEFDPEDVESMHVLTAGYPAEYGRKLGGVVELLTRRDTRQGFHGRASIGGGSFETADSYLDLQYGWKKTSVSLSGDAARSDRYLDPPVEENYTNTGTSRGASFSFDHDWSDNDRTRIVIQNRSAGFEVPNESVQQQAGQRQDRHTNETSADIRQQHIFSSTIIGNLRASVRDVSADLWSNPLSTPIAPFQSRGFRETYLNGSLAGTQGRHEWKLGVEAIFGSVSESFSYKLTNPDYFPPDTPSSFVFNDRRQDREQAVFAQDQIRAGNLTISAGIRFDHYRLMVDDSAFSPRLGISYFIPKAKLIIRASYDRAFQTPAIENLLIASSPAVQALNDYVLRLPVPCSRGNFYQVGFARAFFDHIRLEANWYTRDIDQFSDDDLLLNTGVSFPIAFAHARIHGIETKIEIPQWGRFSGFISYSNMLGVGQFPITGGLFLDPGAADLLRSTAQFPITQDQRNTARARMRYQWHPRLWTAASSSYGSGLPVEVDATDPDALAGYSQRIVNRVNFSRGRVRPSFSIGMEAGATLWTHEQRSLRLQVDASNLTNRLNVIDFAGVFSGTAIAEPRSYALRLLADF